MEFTSTEKRVIVGAVENGIDELIELANNYAIGAVVGVRYEREIAQSVINVIEQLDIISSIQKKLIGSEADKEDVTDALAEVQERIEGLKKVKKILGLFKDDEQPEADDSDGVLGTEAQD